MKRVYKFEIDPNFGYLHTIRGQFSSAFKAVLVAEQNGTLCIWVEVRQHEPEREKTIEVYGTGHTIPDWREHLGSAVCDDFVWHVYTPRRG